MVNEVPEKILEIPGEGGVIKDSPGTENPGGWGVQIKESSMGGGYGYFLEPYIKILLFFDHRSVHLFQSNQCFQEIEFVDSPDLEKL